MEKGIEKGIAKTFHTNQEYIYKDLQMISALSFTSSIDLFSKMS